MNPKKVEIEAKLRAIWEQAGTETFVEALKLFVEARIIVIQQEKNDDGLQAAWENLDRGLSDVKTAETNAALKAAWAEIDQALEASPPPDFLGC